MTCISVGLNIQRLFGHNQYLIDIANLNDSNHHIKLDQASYFIIASNNNDNSISIEQFCYNITRKPYSIFFTGPTAKLLCHTIFNIDQLKIDISASHASYLGRELMKSELAIVLGQKYIQD